MVKNFQEFQTIKLPIKGVLKDPDKHLPIILNYVQNAHLNVVLAYQLIGEKQHRCLICKECFSLPNGKKGSRYINRDIMGALNISRLGKCDLYQQERPEAYQRRQATKGNEDPFGSLSKTVPVISKPLKVKVI